MSVRDWQAIDRHASGESCSLSIPYTCKVLQCTHPRGATPFLGVPILRAYRFLTLPTSPLIFAQALTTYFSSICPAVWQSIQISLRVSLPVSPPPPPPPPPPCPPSQLPFRLYSFAIDTSVRHTLTWQQGRQLSWIPDGKLVVWDF